MDNLLAEAEAKLKALEAREATSRKLRIGVVVPTRLTATKSLLALDYLGGRLPETSRLLRQRIEQFRQARNLLNQTITQADVARTKGESR